MKRRRIYLVAVVDIADVVGAEGQVSEMERPIRIGIYISELAVANSEHINLERIDSLNRVLPSLFAERHRVRFFRSQLGQIDVDVRMGQQDVGDYVAGKNLAQLNVKPHPRYIRDWRVRMFILMNDQPIQ